MENLIFLNIKTSKLLSCGLIFMFLFSGCATGIDSEAEKQKLIDAIVPEIKERVLFDNCWTTVGATGIVDKKSRDVINLGQKLDIDVFAAEGAQHAQHDLTSVNTYGGAAYLLMSGKGVYHIRYPINQQFLFIVNTRPVEVNKWNIQLRSRYKVEKKDRERVKINLNRYSLNSPQNSESIETLLTLDSDSFLASSNFQVNEVTKENLVFDFRNFGYFIDAQLINKTGDSRQYVPNRVGTAIGLVQLCISDEYRE